MKRTATMWTLALLVVAGAGSVRPKAQAISSDATALRDAVERRFEVLPLRDGVALRPRSNMAGIRSIEVTEGPIAIDGQPVTGAELRERLGADADLVLSLSYLADQDRRALFATPSPSRPSATAPIEQPESSRRERQNRARRRDDLVRIGRSISVAEDEVVEGDVVAVGGSVHVEGEVQGDVVAVGGSVTLGPRASVSKNVVVVGGALRQDPAARVGGRIQEVALGSIDFSNWKWRTNPMPFWWGSRAGSVFALVGSLARVAILCLFAAAAVMLGRSYVERAGDRAATEAVKSGAIGFLAQLLFLPLLVITIVVLVMTIVGIPLLLLVPFAILGLGVVGLVGFAGVTWRLGRVVAGRLGWNVDNPYVATIVGVILVLSPALLARFAGLGGGFGTPLAVGLGVLGMAAEYVVWTIGFGAVVLVQFSRRLPALPTLAATAGAD